MDELKSGAAIAEKLSKEFALETMIQLAREHKQHCHGQCGISLSWIDWLLRRAGIPLTDEQEREFC